MSSTSSDSYEYVTESESKSLSSEYETDSESESSKSTKSPDLSPPKSKPSTALAIPLDKNALFMGKIISANNDKLENDTKILTNEETTQSVRVTLQESEKQWAEDQALKILNDLSPPMVAKLTEETKRIQKILKFMSHLKHANYRPETSEYESIEESIQWRWQEVSTSIYLRREVLQDLLPRFQHLIEAQKSNKATDLPEEIKKDLDDQLKKEFYWSTHALADIFRQTIDKAFQERRAEGKAELEWTISPSEPLGEWKNYRIHELRLVQEKVKVKKRFRTVTVKEDKQIKVPIDGSEGDYLTDWHIDHKSEAYLEDNIEKSFCHKATKHGLRPGSIKMTVNFRCRPIHDPNSDPVSAIFKKKFSVTKKPTQSKTPQSVSSPKKHRSIKKNQK